MGEELRRIGVQDITALLTSHHEIGVLVGFLGCDDLRETDEGEVRGDDGHKVLVGIVEGFAVGGNHTVEGKRQRVGLVVIHHPTGFLQQTGHLVPYLFEVFIFLLDDSRDRIRLPDGIDREVSAVLREDIRFGTDGTAIDMTVECDDVVRVGEQGVGIEVLHDLPVVDICGCLHETHVTMDALHGGVEHTVGMLHRLRLEIVSGLQEQQSERQQEDRHSHQQDAETQLQCQRLTDMCENVSHLFLSFVHDVLRVGYQLVEQSSDITTLLFDLFHQVVGFFLCQVVITITDGHHALADGRDG